MRDLHPLLLLGAGLALLLLAGCAAQPADASAQPAAPAYSNYSSPAASGVAGNSGNPASQVSNNASQAQAQAPQGTGTRLTLIKFHGNSQCVSCSNLGKFANSTLERSFQEELAEGKVRYLDINAEADAANPYVQKYKPTRASLYLLTESASGEKFEELAEAWYYTGDEAKYAQYLGKLLYERLGG